MENMYTLKFTDYPCKFSISIPANITMEIIVWNFKSTGIAVYTCNPHKSEIPALRFPNRVPVIPCKHLQCG